MPSKVAVLFKVYAEEGHEDETAARIKETLKPNSMQLEDVAFGIKIIKVLFVHEDNVGSSSFEEKLRKVSGVTEVEVSEESLI